ncbi:hypothetical protein VKT23_008203 [Stygiomarasmius scandens]|uniref:Uncharacterized protein n=1 Tax=Marasmiellus scandens TaxID=2682957 RepID=A0ABR1JI58_9AGAR
MPIPVPPNPAGFALPPAPADPPSHQDILAAKDYSRRVYKAHSIGTANVTAQNVAETEILFHSVVAQSAGEAAAPLWFAPAMAAALAPVNERLD